MSAHRTRVVQWATGNIGTRALREVIRHPDLELAGVLVYDPAKNGVDAGTLCGEAPVGVAATPTGCSPHSTPASTPSFAGSYTSTPTRSSAGCRMTSRNARLPMFPVAHCATR